MKNYIKLFIFSILFCSLLYSCEWDSNNENYVEVKKPEDIIIGIDLAGVRENEIIYIYNDTYLYFSLSTQGKTVLQINFYLDGNIITQDYYNRIYLSVNQIDNNEHDLKAVIALKTGSGSIADYANMEYYLGEYTFKIKFMKNNSDENRLLVNQTLDENRCLKLSWNKSSLPVEKYEVYNVTWWGESDKLIATINPNQNWFVDKNYVYGFQQYKVVAYIYNSPNVYFDGYYTVNYSTINEDNFIVETIGLNKAKLTFNNPNPYAFCLIIKDASGNIYKMKNENNIVITKPLFPVLYSEGRLNFYLLPASHEGENYFDYTSFYKYYSDNHLDNPLIVMTLDVAREQLIGSSFSNFYVFDKNLKTVGSAIIHYNLTTGSQINSLTNGMVAIQDINFLVHLYSDNTLNRELWILPLSYNDRFATGKNIIAVTNYYNTTLSLYDANKATQLLTVGYGENKYTSGFFPFLSYDDRYIAVIYYDFITNLAWYKIFEISGNTLIEKKSEVNIQVNNIVFNYNKPNEVFICYSTRFDIVDLATMQVKKSIIGNFRDVDRITGNLLYKSNSAPGDLTDHYIILDSNYTNEILSFNTGQNFKARLFNNYFMLNDFFIHTDNIKNQ